LEAPTVCRHTLSGASHGHEQGPDPGSNQRSEGKIKEEAGNLVGNEKLEARGKAQKTRGKAQAQYGDVKQHLKDVKKSA
jgi:uncharacterized protein YjbJ (UPF0337 family)